MRCTNEALLSFTAEVSRSLSLLTNHWDCNGSSSGPLDVSDTGALILNGIGRFSQVLGIGLTPVAPIISQAAVVIGSTLTTMGQSLQAHATNQPTSSNLQVNAEQAEATLLTSLKKLCAVLSRQHIKIYPQNGKVIVALEEKPNGAPKECLFSKMLKVSQTIESNEPRG